MRLFIYGTLKRGFPAAGRMAGATYVGDAATEPSWTLLNLGRYPGLVAGRDAVRGELYDVPAALLPTLDAYEGVAEGLYDRIAINTTAGPAETYRYLGPRSHATPCGAEWTG